MPTATELERGNYLIVNSEPVRVTKKEVVAFGTHSHSKLKIFYQPLSGGGEKTINFHHADKVVILEIIRKLGQVISKTNNKIQLMDMVSYETIDAGASADLFSQLMEGDQVTFVDVSGNIQIIEKKAMTAYVQKNILKAVLDEIRKVRQG